MWKIKTLYCDCNTKLLDYRKRGNGRWIKVHQSRISKDFTGIFSGNSLPEGSDIFCPQCQKRIATVRMVNGKWVYKLNQGTIGKIRG